MNNVILADDHYIVKAGITKILQSDPSLNIIGDASNYDELINIIKENHCDLLILDVEMPGKSGLDALPDIRKIKPTLHILILSIHKDSEIIRKAIDNGANGYLNKESAADELLTAIYSILKGKTYIGKTLNSGESEIYQNKYINILPHEELTQREFRIFSYLALGYPAKDISEIMGINQKTVSVIKKSIYDKMNLSSNYDLIKYAIKNKIKLDTNQSNN